MTKILKKLSTHINWVISDCKTMIKNDWGNSDIINESMIYEK